MQLVVLQNRVWQPRLPSSVIVVLQNRVWQPRLPSSVTPNTKWLREKVPQRT